MHQQKKTKQTGRSDNMPDDTSALRKAEKTKTTTQQTPEIAFIHTPKGRILISSDRNFLKSQKHMNPSIKERETSKPFQMKHSK